MNTFEMNRHDLKVADLYGEDGNEQASDYELRRMETTQQYDAKDFCPPGARAFDYFAVDASGKETYIVTEWLYEDYTRELIDDGAFDMADNAHVVLRARCMFVDEATAHFREHLETMTPGFARCEMIMWDTELDAIRRGKEDPNAIVLNPAARYACALTADIMAYQAMNALMEQHLR